MAYRQPCGADYSVSAGEVGSKGVEIDLSGEIMKGVCTSAAYAYTDATVTKGDNLIITGTRFPNVPKNSATIVVTPVFKIGNGTATPGGGVSYVGERLGDVVLRQLVQPGVGHAGHQAHHRPER